MAGVVVSLLVVAVVIAAIILAGAWLWRRYVINSHLYIMWCKHLTISNLCCNDREKPKNIFPMGHFRILFKKDSVLHSKDIDDTPLEEIIRKSYIT